MKTEIKCSSTLLMFIVSFLLLVLGVQCSQRLFSNNGDEAKLTMFKCCLFGTTGIVSMVLQVRSSLFDIQLKF